MKSIPISDLRQRVADVIHDVQTTDEPTIVMQRSRKAAYIVNPERYERDQAELSRYIASASSCTLVALLKP